MRRPLDPRDIPDELRRRLGLLDAVVIGLGSMIGAGIFAALAPAAYAAGSGLLLGLAVAAVVAYCNAISSARLAARYPASGAPMYGRMRLGDFWGYLAGWGFVVGKTASCAAMALTVGFYVWPAQARGGRRRGGGTDRGELRRDTEVRLAHPVDRRRGVGGLDRSRGRRLWLRRCGPGATRYRCRCTRLGMLQAAGLLFFAFAGYARIATLGRRSATRPARSHAPSRWRWASPWRCMPWSPWP